MNTNQKNIRYNYYDIECINIINYVDEEKKLRKITSSFRGKENNPNIIYSKRNLNINYQATNVYLCASSRVTSNKYDGEIVILHKPTTLSLKLYTCFPYISNGPNRTGFDNLINSKSNSLSNKYQNFPVSIELNKYIQRNPSVIEYQTVDKNGEQCVVLYFDNVIRLNSNLDGKTLEDAPFMISASKPDIFILENKLKTSSILQEGFHEAFDFNKMMNSLENDFRKASTTGSFNFSDIPGSFRGKMVKNEDPDEAEAARVNKAKVEAEAARVNKAQVEAEAARVNKAQVEAEATRVNKAQVEAEAARVNKAQVEAEATRVNKAKVEAEAARVNKAAEEKKAQIVAEAARVNKAQVAAEDTGVKNAKIVAEGASALLGEFSSTMKSYFGNGLLYPNEEGGENVNYKNEALIAKQGRNLIPYKVDNSDVIYKCEYLPVDTKDMVQVLQVPIGTPGYHYGVGQRISGLFISTTIFIFVILLIFFTSPILYGLIESLFVSKVFIDNIIYIKTHTNFDVNLLNLIMILSFIAVTIFLLIYGLTMGDIVAISVSLFLPFFALISYVGITFFRRKR
jgi:hypothetical protein